MKSLVGDRPSWHKEPINFLNKMLSIRKVRLLITSRYIAMQSYECVIISKMFLIYFISYGCNGGALVFLGGAEASASPSFALPMFITIKKIIILHLFLGVPAATVSGTGTPWHTRGYAPGMEYLKAQYKGHLFSRFTNQIKSLLLSHHHSTCALVSEILESVLQTVQKQFTYRQYIKTPATRPTDCSLCCPQGDVSAASDPALAD